MSSRSSQGKDKFRVLALNDPTAEAGLILDTIHRRVHTGELFTWAQVVATANSGCHIDTTNAVKAEMHMRYRVRSSGLVAVVVELFENAQMVLPGTPTLPQSNNRTFTVGTSITFASDAAFGSGGLIHTHTVPHGDNYESTEWILHTTSDLQSFFIRAFTADASAQFISIEVEFYEAGALTGVGPG